MSGSLAPRIDLRRIQLILIELLAVTLPFSFELGITNTSRIFFPTEPLMIVLVVIVLAGLLLERGSQSGLFTWHSAIVLPFAAALILGTLFSTLIWVSIKFTAVNLLYLFIFFLVIRMHLVSRPELFRRLVLLYTAGFLLIGILALYRYSLYDWNPVVVKVLFQPFYKDHTLFGATGALLAAFWLSYPGRGRYLTPLLLQRGLGVVLAGAVFLSYSRAAILSLGVFALFRLLFALRARLWQLGIITAVVLIYLFINRDMVAEKINTNRHDSGNRQSDLVDHTLSAANINTDVSNRERLNRWTAGLSMFKSRPGTGFGPGTFQFAYIPFQKPRYMTRLSVTDPLHIPENSGGTAHSEYILSLSETGIPGILAWLALVGALVAMAFRTASVGSAQELVTTGFAAVSTYLFHGFFNNFLNTDKFAFLFWGVIAWMTVNAIKSRKHEIRTL